MEKLIMLVFIALLSHCSLSLGKTIIEMTQEWVKEEKIELVRESRDGAQTDKQYQAADDEYGVIKALDLNPINLVASSYEQTEREELEDFNTLVEILAKPRIPEKYRTGFKLGSVNDFHWQSCGSPGDLVTIDKLTLQPDKLVFPGDVTVSASGKINSAIKAPMSIDFVVQKKLKGNWVPIPCSVLGGCHYDDICPLLDKMCPPSMPCRCPFKAGPVDVPSTTRHVGMQIPEGDYKLHISVMNVDKEVFCLDLQLSIG